ncbi:hypothetical protein BASA84_000647 [Batrachochytrium salamandrivorans]|nr:hypothetical protein BASA84_000647 [Batrachochytrium salamandrivorans]
MSADRGSVDTANNGLTHTTLQAAPIHISQLRPLPDDILHMKETDTACQYCGISYLLLSKYESMNSHVQKVETEMAELKNYIQERPQMLTRIDLLLARQRELEHDQEVTLAAMLEWQTRSQKDTAEVERMQLLNLELNSQLEKLHRNAKQIQHQAELQASASSRNIINLRYGVIQAQSDLAKLKGYFSSCILPNMKADIIAASKHIIGKVSAVQLNLVRDAVEKSDSKAQDTLIVLQKEVTTIKELLNDSERRNERISAELESYKHDYLTHIDEQHVHTRDLQSNCLELENRLYQANGHIMDLTTEREVLYAEKNKIQALVDINQKNQETVCNEYKEELNSLQLKSTREQLEYEKKIATLESFVKRKSSLSQYQVDPEYTNARLIMAKKDEQMVKMECTIRELSQSITGMRKERALMIEAHQSRIKQLQERFLEDVKAASGKEALEMEIEIRRNCVKEKNESMSQLRASMCQDFEMEKNKLQTQIDALKKAYDFSGTVALGRIEAEKKKQAIEFENQIQELNSLRTKESESNRNTVASLERDLAEFKIGQTTQGFNVGQERMAQLQASITSKDAEILFLKDTVRLECEERMGLVAMVAKLQLGMKNGSCNTNVMDSASNQSIPKGDALVSMVSCEKNRQYIGNAEVVNRSIVKSISFAGSRIKVPELSTPISRPIAWQTPDMGGIQRIQKGPKPDQASKSIISQEATEFEMRIHAANAKKDRKMSKQLSGRRLHI